MTRKLWVIFGLAVVIALGAGIGIGYAAGNNTSALNSAKASARKTEAQLRASAATLSGQVSSLQSQLQTAQSNAADAQAKANAAAAAKYKQKMAKVNADLASLSKQRRTLSRELGNVQHNSISSDGVYVVGRDIQPGTWHTSGNGGGFSNQCYYATLNSTNTSDIADNNNFNGPETVNLSGVYAFQISGGCTWVKVG